MTGPAELSAGGRVEGARPRGCRSGGIAPRPAAEGAPGAPASARAAGDRGSASIWLLGVGLAIVLLGGLVAVAGGVIVARHRAQNAADFGALAGALRAVEGASAGCAAAGRLATANGAVVTSCHLDGLDVTVTVRAPVPGGLGTVEASAKAGPVRDAVTS